MMARQVCLKVNQDMIDKVWKCFVKSEREIFEVEYEGKKQMGKKITIVVKRRMPKEERKDS